MPPHVHADVSKHIAVVLVVEEALDVGYLVVGSRVAYVGVFYGLGDVRCVFAGASPEYQRIEQRVRAQPVAAVYADAGDFAGGVQSRKLRLSINVGLDAAHLVVHSGAYRDGFF